MIQADARQIPLADESVELIVMNPPYPGNGVWQENYWQELGNAERECRRVLRPEGFLLELVPIGDAEWWLLIAKDGEIREAWQGRSVMPEPPGRKGWRTLVEDDVAMFVERFSNPGDTVLDPFGGTGVVAWTANRLGRVGVSMDLSMTQAQLARWRCRN